MSKDSQFLVVLLFLIFICDIRISGRSIEGTKKVLVVVSYDGFSNQYFHRNLTPFMDDFRRSGVTAKHMKNVFPTKTYPNHFSIATGVYPEVHGVLSSETFDNRTQKRIKYSYDMFHYNPEAIPIWIWNEMNGGTSGCSMWVGCNYEFLGRNVTHFQKYSTKIAPKDRVDTVINWLKNETNPPNLVLMYIEQPDKTGHQWGVSSKYINKQIETLDLVTRYFDEQLKKHNLDSFTNVIHLSDHGMIDVSKPYFIDLTQYLENGTYTMYGTSPVLQIVPTEDGNTTDIYNRLKEASKINDHFKVYNNTNIPDRWHCKNSDRFGPIIVVADIHYAFQDMVRIAKWYEDKEGVPFTNETKYGIHGYDNEIPSMWPFFMAKGPLFKSNHVIEPFNTVDLVPLFCDILNIPTPPLAAGNLSDIKNILRRTKSYHTRIITSGIIILVLLVILGLAIVLSLFKYRRSRKSRPPDQVVVNIDDRIESQRLMQPSPTNSD